MGIDNNIQKIKNEFTKKAVSQLFDAFEIDNTQAYRKENEDYRELILVVFMALFGSHWDDNIATKKTPEEIEKIRRKCLTASPNYESYFERQDSSKVGAICFGNNYPKLNSIIELGKVDRDAADIEYTKLVSQQIRNSIAHGNFYILNDGTVQVWNDFKYPDGVTPDFRLRLDFMCIVDVCIDLLGKDENINLESLLCELMVKSDKETGESKYSEFIERLKQRAGQKGVDGAETSPLNMDNDIGKELFLKLFLISFAAYNEDYIGNHFFKRQHQKDGWGNNWEMTDEIYRLFGVYDNNMTYLSRGDNFINCMHALLFIHDVRNAAVHNSSKDNNNPNNLVLKVKGDDVTVTRRRYKDWNMRLSADDKYEHKDITYSYEDVLKQITYFVRSNMLVTEKGKGELFIEDEISIDNDKKNTANDFEDR